MLYLFDEAACSFVETEAETLWGLIQSQPVGARSSVWLLVCNWMILSLAKIWDLSVLKGHPFALGRYVSNSFQSGKKVVIFSSF